MTSSVARLAGLLGVCGPLTAPALWNSGGVDGASGTDDDPRAQRRNVSATWGFGARTAIWQPRSTDAHPMLACSAPFGSEPAVYLLDAENWKTLHILRADGAQHDFGGSLTFLDRAPGEPPLLVVGAPGRGDNSGCVSVWDVQTGARLTQVVGAFSGFGSAVAPWTDANGDAKPDLLVGEPAPAREGDLRVSGSIHAVCAATGTRIASWSAPDAVGRFGYVIAPVPDVNSDGRGDFAVVEPGFATELGVQSPGQLWLMSFHGGEFSLLSRARLAASTSVMLAAACWTPDSDRNGVGEIAALTAEPSQAHDDRYRVGVAIFEPKSGRHLSTRLRSDLRLGGVMNTLPGDPLDWAIVADSGPTSRTRLFIGMGRVHDGTYSNTGLLGCLQVSDGGDWERVGATYDLPGNTDPKGYGSSVCVLGDAFDPARPQRLAVGVPDYGLYAGCLAILDATTFDLELMIEPDGNGVTIARCQNGTTILESEGPPSANTR